MPNAASPEGFPLNIVAPGSYYLTQNLAGSPNEPAIQIDASGVTLDLNGFELRGAPASSNSAILVNAPGAVIRNGSIRNWGASGVLSTQANCRVESLLVEDCGFVGIALGDSAIVERCQLESTGQHGIYTESRSRVADCVVRLPSGLAGDGIRVGSNSHVYRCIVTDPVSSFGSGIFAEEGSLVESCTVDLAQSGITGSVRTTLRHNVVRDCSIAIDVQGAAAVRENTLHSGSTGVRIQGGTWLIGNEIDLFSTAGVSSFGNNSVVESNHIVATPIGVQFNAGGNLLIRNTFSLVDTHVSDSGGNRIAPTFDASNFGTATNPFANLIY